MKSFLFIFILSLVPLLYPESAYCQYDQTYEIRDQSTLVSIEGTFNYHHGLGDYKIQISLANSSYTEYNSAGQQLSAGSISRISDNVYLLIPQTSVNQSLIHSELMFSVNSKTDNSVTVNVFTNDQIGSTIEFTKVH